MVRKKDITTGEIIDFTFKERSFLPTALQQVVRMYIHIINSGDLITIDYCYEKGACYSSSACSLFYTFRFSVHVSTTSPASLTSNTKLPLL